MKQINIAFEEDIWEKMLQAAAYIEQDSGIRVTVPNLCRAAVRKWLEQFNTAKENAPDQIQEGQ